MRFDKAAIYIRQRAQKGLQRLKERGAKGWGWPAELVEGASRRLLGLVYENNGRFSDTASSEKNMILYAKLNYCTERS